MNCKFCCSECADSVLVSIRSPQRGIAERFSLGMIMRALKISAALVVAFTLIGVLAYLPVRSRLARTELKTKQFCESLIPVSSSRAPLLAHTLLNRAS
jgi:hypothetical protein